MDYNPYMCGSNFVDLLQSQLSVLGSLEVLVSVLGSSEVLGGESIQERRERRKWTPTYDIVLISSWLNTSKDPVVGNEQRSDKFWKRIAAYFAASQKVAGCERREPMHCKKRWHKINDLVCKFCGAYEAANREKTNGKNESDVLKKVDEIFYNNRQKKFNLEHAWMELRNDQKWCEFHTMWSIKQQDLAMKERLSKMSLRDSLIAQKEPLFECEEALKKRMINDLLSV
ncbi:hypothetical protein N665_0187s0010 [Sinapis alba]|nr:hypothetical protein N665_0187s0010 [Sinapis alba]